MKLLRQLRALFRREKLEAEMAEELRHHLEAQMRRNLAAGMTLDEAHAAARRSFGGVEQIKERSREERARGIRWVEHVVQDLRYAVRQLGRSPGFTAVVVLTLALGIGATTAIFSVVNAMILNPVAGPEPERLVQIGQREVVKDHETLAGVTGPVLEALEAQRDFFAGLAWSDMFVLERQTEDFVVREFGARVPLDFFALLDARPLLGRTFAPGEAVALAPDGVPAKDAPIMLSHRWWRTAFGGDPQVLGRTVEMSGRHFTIVGVMPAHFQFPTDQAEFWVPTEPYRPGPGVVRAPIVQVIARLKPDATAPACQTMLNTIAQRLMTDYPARDRSYGARWRMNPSGLALWVRPLGAVLQDGNGAEDLRRTLFGLLAAIGFVLLIVCANVANLTLARVERRQHELAIRAALGAGRGRLARQLLTENLLLALLGGAAGLIVAAWGMPALAALSHLPRLRPIAVDGVVLGVGCGVSLLTGVIFGLAPIWRGSRVHLGEALAASGANALGGRRGGWYRGALVIVQVAVTVVLLTGAGLMLRSVVQLLKVDPGFDPENLLFVDVPLPWRKYEPQDGAQGTQLKNALYAQLLQRFAALPGVKAVGFLHAYGSAQNISLEGRPDRVEVRLVGCGIEETDAFRAMRIPLLAGRTFARADVEQKSAVLINDSMAGLCWPGESAIGKTFADGAEVPHVVIGVVGDMRPASFTERVLPMFYRPYPEGSGLRIIGGVPPRFILRTARDPRTLVAAARSELKAAEPNLPMPVFSTARQVLYDSTQAQRTYRDYLALFAGVGLLLSALGVYGVLAYSVARRTREIGIRMAIGAGRREVLALVLGEGVHLVGAGMATGLLAAFWLTRFLRSQLFNVSPTDPIVLAAVMIVLAIVALLACWLPARRAAKTDPMIALRCE